MTRERILVLADDLTGAAEIAAIGHSHGLRTALLLGPLNPATDAELLVIDTNSRLLSPELAAQRVKQALNIVPPQHRRHVFKKTDSVLRGGIATELKTACESLGLKGALLCACNPSKNRIIVDGRYTIDGVPLHKTGFASDPYHPRKTDDVCALVGGGALLAPVNISAFPAAGLVIGEAASLADIDQWATRCPTDFLLAGGADAFGAFLRKLGFSEQELAVVPAPQGPHLLLSGSLSPSSKEARTQARRRGVASSDAPEGIITAMQGEYIHAWAEDVDDLLEARGAAIACADTISPDKLGTGPQVRRAFQQLAFILGQEQSFGHLLAEGGDVAACCAEALGWEQLFVEKLWAPGVVTLIPAKAPNLRFTIKPGSYDWSPGIWNLLISAKAAPHP